MDASPVKLAVIGVMLLIGVITLATAFEAGVPAATTTTETAATPSSQATGTATKDKSTQTAEGVPVGIYNGTDQEGLASSVGRTLEREGYVLVELGNTTDLIKKTVVYYSKSSDQAAAEFLADNQFPGAAVNTKPTDLKVVVDGNETSPSRAAAVLVMVGADYAG